MTDFAVSLSLTEWKNRFKVGDIVFCDGLFAEIEITAIGENRFLFKYVDPGRQMFVNNERVRAIANTGLYKLVRRTVADRTHPL